VPAEHRENLRQTLEDRGCRQPLWQLEAPGSRYDEAGNIPFQGRKVHYHNRGD